MSESQLQIVISVINDAAGQLAEVGSQLSALAEQTAGDASDMSASMSGAASSIEGSLSAAEEAAVTAAEAVLSQWTDAAAGMESTVSGAAASVQNEYAGMGNSAELAAAAADEAWQASVAELQSAMAGTTAKVDEDFTSMASTAAASGEEIQSSLSSVGGKLQALGIQGEIAGALILALPTEAIKAAGEQEDAFEQLGNTVANVYSSAATPTAGYAAQVADLTAKVNTERAAIAEGDAAMQKWTGTTVQIAADHEKAAAAIQTAQVNLQKYQQQLDQLTNSQQLAGGSAADTTAQFEAASRASTSLGFDVADSASALQLLFASTGSVTETMGAYQDAMDLSAAKGIDLTTASNDVIQAMSGQGRSLRDLGVNVADGLSGQTALAAIQSKVAGAAEDAATHGLGPYNVAMAHLNKTMGDFGTTVLPMLAAFLTTLNNLISAVDAWAQAHPKLAEALLVFLGIVGGLLVVLSPLLIFLGLLVIATEALNTAMAVFGITLGATIAGVALYIAAFLAIAAVVALVIVYHQQIMDAIKTAWNWIINEVSNAMLFIYDAFTSWGGQVTSWWSGLWNGIYSTLEAVWSKIESILRSITSALSPVTGAVSAVAGAVGSTVSGAIKAFATGGIVNSPTLALVGEAGPEAIIPLSAFAGGSSLGGGGGFGGGLGGGINIYIQGGTYLDQGGATMIAAALAQQIGRQIKLTNFF